MQTSQLFFDAIGAEMTSRGGVSQRKTGGGDYAMVYRSAIFLNWLEGLGITGKYTNCFAIGGNGQIFDLCSHNK